MILEVEADVASMHTTNKALKVSDSLPLNTIWIVVQVEIAW
jgi:hypothetical protein